jgi:MoxR-like ATPase
LTEAVAEHAAAADAVEARAATHRALLTDLAQQIGRVIVGQQPVVDLVLTALVADGHVLLEGAPGLGKTLLVRSLARALRLELRRIQCTPDLMPADVVGTTVLAEQPGGGRSFVFEPGPVFTNLLLADEINRATPRTQSALLEAMQEGAVTTGGATRPLPKPFFVLATQNPIEMEGTYPLPEAQLDRFLLKVRVRPPGREDLVEVLRRTTGEADGGPEPVGGADELLAARAFIRTLPCPEPVLDYAARLVLATHPENADAPERVKRCVRYGASPRGAQALVASARVRALRRGELVAGYADVAAMALPALRHRVLLNFEGIAQGLDPDELVEQVIAAVPRIPGVDPSA